MYPMKITYAGVIEELQPKGKSHAGAINGELNAVVGTCARLGEDCEKEHFRRSVLTCPPPPLPISALLSSGIGNKSIEPGKK